MSLRKNNRGVDWRGESGRGDTCTCLDPAALTDQTCASETESKNYLIIASSHPY